jgi:PAS domain S-box-containing protein
MFSITNSHFDTVSFLAQLPSVVFQLRVSKDAIAFLFVNAAVEDEFEIKPEKLIKDVAFFYNQLSNEDRESLFSSLLQAAENLTPWSWEGRLSLPSGKKKWIKGVAKPQMDVNGKVCLAGTFSDISCFKHNQDLLRQTSLLAKTGVWELDLITNKVYWSEEVFRIHEVDGGKEPELEEAINFYHPQAREMIYSVVEKAAQNGTSWDLELPLITAKGNHIWVRTQGKAIVENNKPVKLYGVFQDINEQKLAEEKIRVIFEYSTDAHLLFGEEGIIDCNNAAVAMLGCQSKEELLKHHPAEFSPEFQPDGRRSDEKSVEMDRLAYENGYHQFEWLHKRINGETFPVMVTISPVPLNEKRLLLVVWHDITWQKRAEDIIRRNEAMLSETQALTHSGSWEADLLTGKNYWSAEAFRIFGLEPATDGPDTYAFGKMIHPDDRELYKNEVQKAISLAENSSFDLRIILPGGQVRYINAIGKPYVNEHGRVTKLYGAIVDITDRKLAEQELIRAKELAEQAAVAKSQFLSTMSHEIRTPMNAVIGFTNLLIQQNPTPQQLEYLNVLKFASDNLLVIINDILDFSKIEEGKITFEMIDFSVEELLDNLRLSLLQKAKEKGLQLKLLIDKDLSEQIVGDPVRLAQILTNLITNAIKFTSKGKVIISALLANRDEQRTAIDFEISDTGIGIAEDKIDIIFERFTQASADTTRKYGGTGLGLTITKRLIELLGGNISVESKPGKGSTFKFRLSFKNGSKEFINVKKRRAAKPMESLKGIKVLIAEDNDINIMLIGQFMKMWEVDYDIVLNGLAAVEQAQLKNYDMIFMDLQMPEMDGYEAAFAIRNLPGEKYKTIPIIALTASAMLDIKERAFEAGMTDYISKPFQPEELHRKIQYYKKLTSQGY